MSGSRPDPIQRAAESGRDLYDVATWERRSVLDGIATRVYGALVTSGRAIVVGLALLILLGQIALVGAALTQDPIIGVYIFASIVPAMVIAVYVWRSDVTTPQPLDSLVVTFLLGFLFASFAAVVNSSLQGLFFAFGPIGIGLFFYLIVAPIEETVKWLAIRLYGYRREEFSAVIDGAVYGAVAGLGFATIENTIYITQQYLQTAATSATGTPLVPTLQTAAVRSFAGPGHVIYSAFAGYYLGLAKFNPENRGPIVVKGLLIAAFIHGTYNVLVSNLEVGLALLSPVVAIPAGLGFVLFVVVYDGVFLLALYTKIRTYGRLFAETGAAAVYGDEGAGDEEGDLPGDVAEPGDGDDVSDTEEVGEDAAGNGAADQSN
ncbi:MAG: PrsW family intramembrane metalloprotease [Halanaeroarchaeum sp.]